MIPKIYLQENTHIFDEPYEDIWGSGVPDNASVDLVEWIQKGITDGTFGGGGFGGVSNLSTGVNTSTIFSIANSNGTGVIIPAATTTLAGLLTAPTLININSLVTLTGIAANALDLGIFTGTTINDASSIKVALQSLETALEVKGSRLLFQDESVATGAPGTVSTINFIGSAITASQVGSLLTIVATGGSGTTSITAAKEYYTIIPIGTNVVPDLPVIPTDGTKVLISINGNIERNGISVNTLGQFTVIPIQLGYNIDATDTIVVQYFTT